MATVKMSMEVKGGDLVLKKLRRLPPEVAGNHLIKSMQKGGRVMKQSIMRRTPIADRSIYSADKRGSVRLRSTIISEVTHKRFESAELQVGPDYRIPHARIAHLVEWGHGGPHPAAPRPFMRPAYEGSKLTVARIVMKDLLRRVLGMVSRA